MELLGVLALFVLCESLGVFANIMAIKNPFWFEELNPLWVKLEQLSKFKYIRCFLHPLFLSVLFIDFYVTEQPILIGALIGFNIFNAYFDLTQYFHARKCIKMNCVVGRAWINKAKRVNRICKDCRGGE